MRPQGAFFGKVAGSSHRRPPGDLIRARCRDEILVPLAGIEPALLAESDFESDASTSSAIGATRPFVTE